MDEYAYDAFISYKNAPPDRDVAGELRRLLEHFRIPKELRKGNRKTLKCFLDRLELSASADLPEAIKLALSRSAFLILVCSPEAAASTWVAREIQFFVKAGRRDEILILLLAGSKEESIPPALEGEPRYVDIRAATTAQSVKALRKELVQFVAPILGCKLDDLIQRRKKETRTRRMIGAVASLIILAGFIVLAKFAMEERRGKEQEQRVATARRLMAPALSPREQRTELLPVDVLLSIESFRLSPTPEARASLENAARKLARLTGQMTDAQIDALAFREAALDSKLMKGVRDVKIGDRVVRIVFDKELAAVTNDGELLADVSDAVKVWDIASGKEVVQVRHGPDVCDAGVNRMAFSSDDALLATAGVDGDFVVWDLDSGEELLREFLGTPFDPERDIANVRCDEPVNAVAFSPDGRILASSNPDGTTRIWDISTGKQIALITSDEVLSLAFSPSGEFLATGGRDGSVRIWATGPWQDREQMPVDYVRVWDKERWREVARASHKDAVNALAFSSDDRFLATASADHSARVWDVDHVNGDYNYRRYREDIAGQVYPQVWQVQTLPELLRMTHDDPVTSVVVSPDDQWIATIGDDGHARFWDAKPRPDVKRDDQKLIDDVCSSLTRNLTAAEWRQHMGNAPYRKTCASR